MNDQTPRCDAIVIGAGDLGADAIVRIARDNAPVSVADEAIARLIAARSAIDQALARDETVYGLTTGLGAAVDTRLKPSDIDAFQQRAVRARAVGVGDFFSAEETRATLAARLVGLARGASGASPAFVPAIEAMLNRGVHPRIRRIGSLGEADLSPLAQAFLPFAGGGEIEFHGAIVSGPEGLRLAGIDAPAFGPKDGLALINANAASAGLAALAIHDVTRALDAATIAGALSLDAWRANLSPIDPRVVALRPAPGQERGAALLRALLTDSDLHGGGQARRVQDPLSFRCLAPVNGYALTQADTARTTIKAELNGACDSPAVLPNGALMSTVNFDTTALALSLEALGLAAAHVATLATFRIMKLMSPALSDLPRFLTRHGGTHAGFATTQKTAAALDAEIRRLALPLGPMTAPVADGVEDYAPMTPAIVDKTTAIGTRLNSLAAIELVVAAEAADLRGAIRLGQGTRRAHEFVRCYVAPLDDDRPMGVEYERLAAAIRAGELARAVEAAR